MVLLNMKVSLSWLVAVPNAEAGLCSLMLMFSTVDLGEDSTSMGAASLPAVGSSAVGAAIGVSTTSIY